MTTHIKKWMGGILLLVFFCTLAPLLAGWRVRGITDTAERDLPLSPQNLYEQLQLTTLQRGKLDGLESAYRKEIHRACERHSGARMRIAEMLESGKLDPQLLLRLQREVGNAYAAAEESTVRHMVRVADILDSDQRAVFLARVGEHLRSSCPPEFSDQ
jgi:hypothetical protein